MYKFMPALLLGLGALLPLPAQAAGVMDETTKLHLRCGAGYLLAAADPEMSDSPEDAATMRQMGETLLTHADSLLTALGMTAREREQVGAHYMAEMDAVFTNDLDLGFDAEQCTMLVAEATLTTMSPDIDKYLTCGGGFMVAAGIKQQEGDNATAQMLDELANRLLGHGEDLMVAAGFHEVVRYEIGKSIGVSVATKMNAGEVLPYGWELCASLDS